jgi:hypothetical protein
MTKVTQQIDKPSGSRLILITILLLVLGLCGCAGVYIKFSTPDVPPAPCPIQELLLDVSDFPENGWEETGSRSARGAPVRMGIERIGTSFSITNNGAFHEVYRFKDEYQADKAYDDSTEPWFTHAQHRTEWETPPETDISVNADQFRIGCNDRKQGGFEQCQYVAQYGPYIIRFFAHIRILSYKEFIDLVKKTDQRATNCLEQ